MFAGSKIELSRSALVNNLGFIRSLLQPATRLSAVIKGNAYGHGICEMAILLQETSIDHFSVFNAEEAHEVFKYIRDTDQLLIMGDVDGDALAWAIENGVEFFAFDLHRINHAIQIAEKMKTKALIHVEVETGMNRTGLSAKEYKQALSLLIKNQEWASFRGLCTHFAGAESTANFHRVKSQIRKYRSAVEMTRKVELAPEYKHTCCSAGLLRFPHMHLDLVRVGILQYGHWPSTETRIEFLTRKKLTDDPLQRILTWKSRIMHIKPVKTGQFIGYGNSFQAASDMNVAVVPIGYGYGYSRSLSNQGFVLIHGKRAPVIGTINMNALSVDISKIPEAQRGDDVVLIGSQGNEEITVSSFGELSRQLNYELLTRLPHSIPRNIVK